MAEVLLFHHAQGLTRGVYAFANELRTAGHTVHTPDLFDGRTFQSIDEGLAYIRGIGFDEVRDRGVRVADALPAALVYAGFSFGVLPAQKLAQTRPGARGALLFYSCLPISGPWAFGPWPDGVPVQIHGMDHDPIFIGEGDIDAAREIVATVEDAELFLYPGDQHYFADSSAHPTGARVPRPRRAYSITVSSSAPPARSVGTSVGSPLSEAHRRHLCPRRDLPVLSQGGPPPRLSHCPHLVKVAALIPL